nr:MAG TPA: hypothetical protein [Caudoviricetes sp.]
MTSLKRAALISGKRCYVILCTEVIVTVFRWFSSTYILLLSF